MKAPDPYDLKPCPHMRVLVPCWLDGALTGFARWYTAFHVAHCPQCRSSLPFLRTLHDRLERIGAHPPEAALTPDRWERIEAAWRGTDPGAA